MLCSSGIVVILSSTSEEDNAADDDETLDILAGSPDEATSSGPVPAGRKRRLLEDAPDGSAAAGVAAVEARGPSRRKAKAPKRAQTEAEPAAADVKVQAEPLDDIRSASAFAQQDGPSSKQPAAGPQWLRLSAAALAPKPQPTSAAQPADAAAQRDSLETPASPADVPNKSSPALEAPPPLAPVASAPTPMPSSQPAVASAAAASESCKPPPPKPASAALDHAASAPAADASAGLAAFGPHGHSAAGPSLASWLTSRPPRAAAPVQGQLREADGRQNTGTKKSQGSGAAAASAAAKRKGQAAAAAPAKKKPKYVKKAQIGAGTVKVDVAKRENEMRELARQFADDAGAFTRRSMHATDAA